LSSSDLLAAANAYAGSLKSFAGLVGIDWLAPAQLGKLIELASYDIHGMLSLRVDGDCFDPPECWCTLGGWNGVVKGAGGTPNEAILRAMRMRQTRGKRLPVGVVRVDWEFMTDKPYNEDLT